MFEKIFKLKLKSTFLESCFNQFSFKRCHETDLSTVALKEIYSYYINSFNTRPPAQVVGHGNQLMYEPPGRGVNLGFRFGISVDKILQFVAFHWVTILNTSHKQNHVCFGRFSIRDISCKQNVKVQVKLIHFHAGLNNNINFLNYKEVSVCLLVLPNPLFLLIDLFLLCF